MFHCWFLPIVVRGARLWRLACVFKEFTVLMTDFKQTWETRIKIAASLLQMFHFLCKAWNLELFLTKCWTHALSATGVTMQDTALEEGGCTMKENMQRIWFPVVCGWVSEHATQIWTSTGDNVVVSLCVKKDWIASALRSCAPAALFCHLDPEKSAAAVNENWSECLSVY